MPISTTVLYLGLAVLVLTLIGSLRRPRDNSPQAQLDRLLHDGKITAAEYRTRMATLNSRSGKRPSR